MKLQRKIYQYESWGRAQDGEKGNWGSNASFISNLLCDLGKLFSSLTPISLFVDISNYWAATVSKMLSIY